MKQHQRIAKNMMVIVSSEIVGFGLNFVMTIVLARYLGVIGFGKYSFVLAFVWVFQMLADSGLSNIMIREISVKKNDLAYQLGVTKSLIWIFSVIVFVLIVAAANILNPEPIIRKTIYVMGLAVLATIHAVGYSSVFRAMEEMEYNAAGFVLHKFLLFSLILVVIRLRLGLVEISAAYLVSNLLLWFFYYTIISRRYQRPRMISDAKAWRYFIAEALPVGAASILRKVSWQVDILILSAIGTASSVGLFSAPYKVVQSINLVPHTLAMPLFPLFSRLARDSHEELFRTYEKNLKFMCLMSIPVVVILVTLSYPIVSLLFGARFAGSSAALQILGLTVLFLFPTSQFIYLFSALGRQRLYTVSSVLCLIINILIDLILIPHLDYIGACLGTLIAEISLFTISVYFIKRTYSGISFIRASWKSVVSGLFMGAVLFQFRHSSLPWVSFGILSGAIVYVASSVALRTLSRGDLDTVMEGVRFARRIPPASVSVAGDKTRR